MSMPVIFLMGPTASGKTALAFDLNNNNNNNNNKYI